MVSLQTADNALKSFYLDAVSDSLNHKVNPFLAAVQSSSANVWGKDVRKLVRYGMHGGIGAGTETGDLPKAGGNNYVQFVAPLKNLYGSIEISDKAIRAAENNEGAFVNLLNDEMEGLIKNATFEFGRMLFGSSVNERHSITKREGNSFWLINSENLFEGMQVYVTDEDKQEIPDIGARRIVKIDRNMHIVTVDGDSMDDYLGDEASGYLAVCKDPSLGLTGLDAIFNADELYGVKKEDYCFMRPIIRRNFGTFNENGVQTIIDKVEEYSGSTINFIVCSWGVRRAIVSYYKELGVNVQTVELEGGFKTISFNGIPVVTDRFCPEGTMYLLNTDDFKLYQLCDWQWLEGDDGKILHQVPGKPVYTATLVKYAELLCERPGGQAVITDIDEG